MSSDPLNAVKDNNQHNDTELWLYECIFHFTRQDILENTLTCNLVEFDEKINAARNLFLLLVLNGLSKQKKSWNDSKWTSDVLISLGFFSPIGQSETSCFTLSC